MRVIVTRPPAQAAGWVQALQALGLDAAALPLLGIAPPQDTGPVHEAWARLHTFRLVTFVSPNAVQYFFAERPAGAPWPEGTAAGSTGPGTSAALREQGLGGSALVEPATDAPSFDSEALWAQVCSWPWAGQKVLVVRGEEGRDWLATTLRAQGAEVCFVAAYRRLQPTLDAAAAALLDAGAGRPPADHAWLFSSSEAVQWLRSLAPAADWRAARALATHPRIAETARSLGFGQVDARRPAARSRARGLAGGGLTPGTYNRKPVSATSSESPEALPAPPAPPAVAPAVVAGAVPVVAATPQARAAGSPPARCC
jgi:uroporphyrinogen-III synthase